MGERRSSCLAVPRPRTVAGAHAAGQARIVQGWDDGNTHHHTVRRRGCCSQPCMSELMLPKPPSSSRGGPDTRTAGCWVDCVQRCRWRDHPAAPVPSGAPTLVVLEATGGLERLIGEHAGTAGLPVAVVNPRRRDFAKATGPYGCARCSGPGPLRGRRAATAPPAPRSANGRTSGAPDAPTPWCSN